MKGDPDVVEILNECLSAELTAINQYYAHSKMCGNWGYQRLAKKKMEEAMEEMRHADHAIERILYLEGVPNMQRLFPVRIGENPVEQHEVDLALAREAAARLNKGIAVCTAKGDNGTRLVLETMLKDEEESIEWLEAQLGLVQEIGKDHYLAQQLRE